MRNVNKHNNALHSIFGWQYKPLSIIPLLTVFPSRSIGTGSSCIYPLLGCRMNSWRFLATEVDCEAVKYAVENVERNGLSDKIEGTLCVLAILCAHVLGKGSTET